MTEPTPLSNFEAFDAETSTSDQLQNYEDEAARRQALVDEVEAAERKADKQAAHLAGANAALAAAKAKLDEYDGSVTPNGGIGHGLD